MNRKFISFIDFTNLNDEDKYKLLILKENKIDKAIEYIEEDILNNKIEKVDWEFDDCNYSDMPAERIKPLIDILKDGK